MYLSHFEIIAVLFFNTITANIITMYRGGSGVGFPCFILAHKEKKEELKKTNNRFQMTVQSVH